MGKKKALEAALDQWTDEYNGHSQWWWNADTVLAQMVSMAARHLRKDGMAAYGDNDVADLKRIEKLFGNWLELGPGETDEAMELLVRWLPRFWD